MSSIVLASPFAPTKIWRIALPVRPGLWLHWACARATASRSCSGRPAVCRAVAGAQRYRAGVVPLTGNFKARNSNTCCRTPWGKTLIAHADLLGGARSRINCRAAWAVAVPGELRRALNWASVSTACCRTQHERSGRVRRALERPPPARRPSSINLGTTADPRRVRPPAVRKRRKRSRPPWPCLRQPARPAHAAAARLSRRPNAMALSTLRSGGTLAILPRFDPEAFCPSRAASHQHVFMVPTMFVRLLRLPRATRARYDLSSLEWLLLVRRLVRPKQKHA